MNSVFSGIATLSLAMSSMSLADSRTYRVEFVSNWNEKDHLDVPSSAHFSPIVAVSHNSQFDLLPLGSHASSGLESVAELGTTNEIFQEINSAQEQGLVGTTMTTTNLFLDGDGKQVFDIEISPEHPYLSFVSMIAPSPDWIVGISGLKLYSAETGFYEGFKRQQPLLAIDAGTENGDTGGNFSLNNDDTSPHEPISYLNGRGFSQPFAYITITPVVMDSEADFQEIQPNENSDQFVVGSTNCPIPYEFDGQKCTVYSDEFNLTCEYPRAASARRLPGYPQSKPRVRCYCPNNYQSDSEGSCVQFAFIVDLKCVYPEKLVIPTDGSNNYSCTHPDKN